MSEHLDIICIGESLIELSTNESLTYAKILNKYYGGDTITAAIAASRLGSNVGYITRVGNDYFKDFLLDSWQAENLDTSHVKLVEGTNGLYFISRLQSGEKEFAYYRKKTAATNLSIDDISVDYIKKARMVYSTGITQSLSVTTKEAVKTVFKLAKENGISVAYDPNFTTRVWDVDEAKEAFEEIIEYVDILMLSLKHDAQRLYGMTSPDMVIKYFWDQGVSIVVVRDNQGNATIGYNGEIITLFHPDEEVIDTTGAGDAFNGGFLHGIAAGYTPFEAAKLALIVTGFQIKSIGAISSIPSKHDVYSEFKFSND
ncbi:MAG: sugar kinase [Candidatus Gastranaerophilaceae bacterium]|jgi:2-dehydro-3-deoxygluconokinase